MNLIAGIINHELGFWFRRKSIIYAQTYEIFLIQPSFYIERQQL